MARPNIHSAVFPVTVLGMAMALFLVFSFTVTHSIAQAQFTPEINYQGKLLDSTGATVANGLYHMRFHLYDAETGGSLLWSEDRSALPGNRPQVTSGLFSVMLGSSTSLTGVDFNQPLYLEVSIGGIASSSWETLSPRKRIGSVPSAFYAYEAGTVGGVASSSFLRSDQSDSFTAGTLTLDVGTSLVVNGSGTFANATATQLYATTLGLNSEYFSSLTGAGLINSNGTLTVDDAAFLTSSAWYATTSAPQLTSLANLASIGTITSGVWQGTAIADAYITKTGNWTGTFDGQEGTYYLSLANATGNTDNLTQGSTNLFSQWTNATGGINYAGGNVGIGTSTPSSKLTVNGAALFAGSLGTTQIEHSLTVAGTTTLATTTGVILDTGGGVCNVKAYGARGDNSTDNYAAIMAAIDACQAGGVVYFPPGEYRISQTIVLDTPVTLRGSYAPRWSYSSIPRSSIRATFGSFVGTSIIHVRDKSISGEAANNNGGRIENIGIDGGSWGTDIHGIHFEGLVRDWKLTDVDISQTTGNGFLAEVGAGSGNPRGFTIRGLSIYSADGHGFRATALNDSYLEDVLVVGNALRGFYLSSIGETKLNNSRAAFNALEGLYIDGASNNGGLQVTDFSTDRNDRHGVRISATGTTTISFNGLLTRRDGKNDGGGTETPYAGVAIIGSSTGKVAPVVISNLTQITGIDDGGGGTPSPSVGLRVDQAKYVVVDGVLWGVDQAYVDGGTNDTFVIAEETLMKVGHDAAVAESLYNRKWVRGVGSVSFNEQVGIGTTTPTSKFFVVNNDTTSAVATLAGATGQAADYLRIKSTYGQDVGDILTVNASGYLGIGTTTMPRRLTIAGSDNVGARFTNSINDARFDLRVETSQAFIGTMSNHDLRFITNGASKVAITAGGNMGVGTTTPYARLSVKAGTSATGAIVFSVTDSSNVELWKINDYGTSTVANGINITGGCYAVNNSCLTAGGGGDSGTVNSGTTGQVAYYSANGTAVVGTSSLFIHPGGTVEVNGNSLVVDQGAVFNADSGNFDFQVQSDTNAYALFVDASADRVGIATSSPWAKLSVNYVDGTDTGPRFTVGSSTQTNLSVSATGGVGINTDVVGVGTELRIVGSAGGSADFLLAEGTFNQAWSFSAQTDGRFTFYDATNDKNPFYVEANTPTNTLYLDSSGFVGIGTSTPRATLTIQGTSGTNPIFQLASSSGLSLLTVDYTGSTTATNGFNITAGCYAIGGTCIGGGGSSVWTLNGSNAYYTAGNVGIGTTTPPTALYVAGTGATTTIEGSLSVANGAIFHDYSQGQTSISQLALGNMRFDTNAGKVTWVDLPISASAATNTVMAYRAAIDDLDALTVWSRATGEVSATAKDLRIVIGSVADSVLSSSNIAGGSLIIANGAICVDDGGGTNCDDATRTAGNIYAESSTVTAIDLAENYPVSSSNPTPQPGEIVMMATKEAYLCQEITDMGSYLECTERFTGEVPIVEIADRKRTNFATASTTATSTLEVAQDRYEAPPTLLGVVSTEPGVLLGGFGKDELIEYDKVPVALSGRVPVKVNGEGGDIKPGDRIALSSTPGTGMKAVDAGETVGIALTSFNQDDETGEVMLFVDLRFYIPSIDDLIANRTYEASSPLTTRLAQLLDIVWQPLGRYVTAGVGWFDEIISRNIVSEEVTAETLCLNDVCISETELQELLDLRSNHSAQQQNSTTISSTGTSGQTETVSSNQSSSTPSATSGTITLDAQDTTPPETTATSSEETTPAPPADEPEATTDDNDTSGESDNSPLTTITSDSEQPIDGEEVVDPESTPETPAPEPAPTPEPTEPTI